MAAPNDASGSIKYWQDGAPAAGVQVAGNDAGSIKFWQDGKPAGGLFVPAATSGKSMLLLLGVGR